MKTQKLAASFGLEEYRDFKIENGSIYIIQEDKNGRKYWLHFGKTLAYKNQHGKNYLSNIFKDIKSKL